MHFFDRKNHMYGGHAIVGAHVPLACGLAFGGIVYQYKDKDKLSAEEAKQRAKEHLIPGVIIQPSGFFAVLKAQEEGCHYMLGS